MRRDDLDGGIPTLAVALPDDLKERLEAFVPPPVAATLESLEQLPAAYDRPLERWNAETKKHERRTERIPLTVRETEPGSARGLGLPPAGPASPFRVSARPTRPLARHRRVGYRDPEPGAAPPGATWPRLTRCGKAPLDRLGSELVPPEGGSAKRPLPPSTLRFS